MQAWQFVAQSLFMTFQISSNGGENKSEQGELTRPSRTCNHSFPCGVSNQNVLTANLRQVVLLGREETETEAELGARKALLVLPLTHMKLPLPSSLDS